MSVFNKVITAHDAAVAAQQEARDDAIAAKASAEELFKQEFEDRASQIARPIFEQFAQDARSHGFPAEVAQKPEGNGNPTISVRIVPVRGASLPTTNKSDEAVFCLRGIVKDQKVEHVSYYDQRPDKNGVKRGSFGIPSINQAVIERDLEEFLTAALKARG